MEQRRYERNPYSECVVRVMCEWAQDYADAGAVLDKDPENERAKITKEMCMDFAAWMHELTGFGRKRMGQMILKMMEADDDEE